MTKRNIIKKMGAGGVFFMQKWVSFSKVASILTPPPFVHPVTSARSVMRESSPDKEWRSRLHHLVLHCPTGLRAGEEPNRSSHRNVTSTAGALTFPPRHTRVAYLSLYPQPISFFHKYRYIYDIIGYESPAPHDIDH